MGHQGTEHRQGNALAVKMFTKSGQQAAHFVQELVVHCNYDDDNQAVDQYDLEHGTGFFLATKYVQSNIHLSGRPITRLQITTCCFPKLKGPAVAPLDFKESPCDDV
ncbi:hypothetical protein GCM10022265_28970 [Marinobacter xestospongiae]